MINEKELVKLAIEARKDAYTPYSHFKVGAALVAEDGTIYKGCNIECAAYSACTCAERTALIRAVADGHKKFLAVAVVGGHEDEKDNFSNYSSPCGVCRQYLREFCDPKEMKIIVGKSEDDFKTFTLEEMLPLSFGPDHLN